MSGQPGAATRITSDMVTPVEVHRFVVEASSIGLRPGQWPAHLETDMGNGQPLVRARVELDDGEVQSVTYQQAMGCIALLVLND